MHAAGAFKFSAKATKHLQSNVRMQRAAHKSEVTKQGAEQTRRRGNTCRFLWRRALNSPG